MRRPILVALALVALPALAYAGATVEDGNDTLKIKAAFDPAQASHARGPLRPTALKYDYWAGTKNDKRLPDLRSVRIRLGGAKFAFDSFRKCDESDLTNDGPSACPAGSKVGSGTAVAEVRPPDDPTAKSNLPVDVTLYNGKIETDRNGATRATPISGLLFYTKVATANVVVQFEGERHGTRITYYNPEDDPNPPGDNSLYELKEVHVTLPRKTRRVHGRRVPFLGTPRTCPGHWTVSTTDDRYQGGEITATHRVRCTSA